MGPKTRSALTRMLGLLLCPRPATWAEALCCCPQLPLQAHSAPLTCLCPPRLTTQTRAMAPCPLPSVLLAQPMEAPEEPAGRERGRLGVNALSLCLPGHLRSQPRQGGPQHSTLAPSAFSSLPPLAPSAPEL